MLCLAKTGFLYTLAICPRGLSVHASTFLERTTRVWRSRARSRGRTIVYEISPSLFLLLLPWFLWTFFSLLLLLVILVAGNFSVFLPEPAFPTFQNQIVRWMMGSFFFPASIHFFFGSEQALIFSHTWPIVMDEI